MRRYTLYNLLPTILTGLCMGWLLMACSDNGNDQPKGPAICTVMITLQTSSPTYPTTRAGDGEEENPSATPETGTPDKEVWEEDDAYERNIEDWLVVAYNSDGSLAGFTSSEGTYNVRDENSQTSVEMKLPVGPYHFYAFANLKSLENGEKLLERIMQTATETDQLLTEAGLQQAVQLLASKGTSIDWRNGGKFALNNGILIPMSSYAQETVLVEESENRLTIPLIRMIGKVQVDITNNLSNSITVNQLDIINLNPGSRSIWLLPWGENKYLEFNNGFNTEADRGQRAPLFPDETGANSFFTETIKPAQGETNIEKGNTRYYTHYIPETNAASKTGILLGVDIVGRTRTEHLTGFDFVRRNDLLVIPVKLTDIETTLAFVEQRIPIGVYPTTITYGGGDGVQVLTPKNYSLQAAGILSVRFKINQINGVTGDFSIQGLPRGEAVPVTWKYSSIRMEKNEYSLITAINGHKCDENGLIPETNGDDSARNAAIFIYEDELEAGNDGSGSSQESAGKKQGVFTVETQEIGHQAEATIALTLIVTYGDNQEMQIPYTINIRNY